MAMNVERLMTLLSAYDANPEQFTEEQTEYLQQLAQEAGVDWAPKTSMSRMARNAIFGAADTAAFGLLPNEWAGPAITGAERTARGVGSAAGMFLGGPAALGRMAGGAAAKGMGKLLAKGIIPQTMKTAAAKAVAIGADPAGGGAAGVLGKALGRAGDIARTAGRNIAPLAENAVRAGAQYGTMAAAGDLSNPQEAIQKFFQGATTSSIGATLGALTPPQYKALAATIYGLFGGGSTQSVENALIGMASFYGGKISPRAISAGATAAPELPGVAQNTFAASSRAGMNPTTAMERALETNKMYKTYQPFMRNISQTSGYAPAMEAGIVPPQTSTMLNDLTRRGLFKRAAPVDINAAAGKTVIDKWNIPDIVAPTPVAAPAAPPVRPVVPPQSAYRPTVKKATTNIKWKNVPPEKVAEAARRALMEKGQPGKTYAMGKLRGMGYSSAEAGKIISDAEKALQSAGKLPYTVKAKARQAAGRTAKPVGSQKNTVVTVDAVPTRSALSGEVLGSMQAEAKKVLKMFPNDVETGVIRAMEKLVYHGVPSEEAAQIIESLL